MKNYMIPAGMLTSLLFCLTKDADAQNGVYISPGKYSLRELHYGHVHDPYYTALNTRLDDGESRPIFEFGLTHDERKDIEVPFWPYAHLGFKWFSDDFPVCVEGRAYSGDYLKDATPRTFIGYSPTRITVDDNFHYQVGAEFFGFRPKGLKAYMTMMAKRASGGRYFVDFNPGIGRELVSDNGDPVLKNRLTYDLYTNVGYTTKKGNTFAASVNIDEGKFRNAYAGYGKKGANIRVGVDASGRFSAAATVRTLIPKSRKVRR